MIPLETNRNQIRAAQGTVASRRKLFGRKIGKPLSAHQKELMENLLPSLGVLGSSSIGRGSDNQDIDLAQLFARAGPTWLEVGFGGGEHLVRQASANSGVNLIGCEPYTNGIARLLGEIEALNLTNIRVHPGDARDVLDSLPNASLSRVFVLFPDPWPKKRHHTRRFMCEDNLNVLRDKMTSGAELRLATDIPDYARFALDAVNNTVGLTCLESSAIARNRPWPDWSGTRYASKALKAGRSPQYITIWRH